MGIYDVEVMHVYQGMVIYAQDKVIYAGKEICADKENYADKEIGIYVAAESVIFGVIWI